MDILEGLTREHREMEALLAELEGSTHHLPAWEAAAKRFFHAVHRHEAAEERILFPAIHAASREARDCLETLEAEHRRIIETSYNLKRALETRDPVLVASSTTALGQLVRAHWRREEQLLFPVAGRDLSRERLTQLTAAWESL